MKWVRYRTLKIVVWLVLFTGLCAPALLRATSFFYQFNNAFNGMTPTGPAPWVKTLFTDVSPGVVQLTISAPDLTGPEYLGSLLLNLDPSLNPNKLTFTEITKTGSFTLPTIADGENKYKATGDGKYDVEFSFSEKASKTFTGGDSVTFDISSTAYVLDAQDFDFLSTSSAGKGPFLAAAEIMGIPGCDTSTGWISASTLTNAPEPSPFALLTVAAGLLAGVRLLRFRRA